MVFRTVQLTQVKRLEKLYQHLTEKRLTLFLDLNILLQRLSWLPHNDRFENYDPNLHNMQGRIIVLNNIEIRHRKRNNAMADNWNLCTVEITVTENTSYMQTF